MPCGLAPGGHVLLDPFVIGHDFQDLAQRQFFDFLARHDDGHRTKISERVELYIRLHNYNDCLALQPQSNEQVDTALLRFGQIGRDACKLIDAVDQCLLADAHQSHRGRAGDKADA
jgi:hypothetical protein